MPCDHQGASLSPLRQEREQHLHLLGVLLNVADVVDNEHLVLVQLARRTRQAEVSPQNALWLRPLALNRRKTSRRLLAKPGTLALLICTPPT